MAELSAKGALGVNPGTAAQTTTRQNTKTGEHTQLTAIAGDDDTVVANVNQRGELSIEATALNQLVDQNRTIILLLGAIRLQLADMSGVNFSDEEVAQFVPENLYDN